MLSDSVMPKFFDALDCRLPCSSVHGDSLDKNIGVELPCTPTGDLPDLGIKPISLVSCIGRRVLYH